MSFISYLFQNFLDRETFNSFLSTIDGESIFDQLIECIKFVTANVKKYLKRFYDIMICKKDVNEEEQEENGQEPNGML